MCWLLFAGLWRLPPDLVEGSNDLGIYRATGEAILRGDVPYLDFFVEYPPGSLPVFLPPAYFSSDNAGFIALFAAEMALALTLTLVLTALAARRMRGSRAWVVPSVTLAAATVLLYPVALTRYDAIVALALAVAVVGVASGRRWHLAACAALGFGAAAKLVPALAMLPLALDRRTAVRGLAVFFGVLVVFFAPALLLGGAGFTESFAYHADRGLQLESLGASILMRLGLVSNVVFDFGAFEVRGGGVDLAAALSLPVTGALLVVTVLVILRDHRRHGFAAVRFPRQAAALILAFMLGSKVLSPQYMIWLLPLVPVSFGGVTGAGVCVLFLAVCFTTTQVFPFHYGDLINLRQPGPDLLLGRNLLLALLWALLLVLPHGPRKDESAR